MAVALQKLCGRKSPTFAPNLLFCNPGGAAGTPLWWLYPKLNVPRHCPGKHATLDEQTRALMPENEPIACVDNVGFPAGALLSRVLE